MAQDDALERFRRQWVEDLQQKPVSTSTTQTTNATTEGDGHSRKRTIREIQDSDDEDEEAPNMRLFATNPLVEALVNDFNEIDPVNFLGSLPVELALHVFKWLSVDDLCQCAQVNSDWCYGAELESIWYRKCHQMGWELNVKLDERRNWKDVYRQHYNRRLTLRRNWKERLCAVNEFYYSAICARTPILSSVEFHAGLLVTGYRDGTVKLWDVANGNKAWEFCHPLERHPITCLDADRDAGLLVGGSMFGLLQMWHLGSATVEGAFATGATVRDVSICPDGSVLAASGRRLQVYKRKDSEDDDSNVWRNDGEIEEAGVISSMRLISSRLRTSFGEHWERTEEVGRARYKSIALETGTQRPRPSAHNQGERVLAAVACADTGTVNLVDVTPGRIIRTAHQLCNFGSWTKVSAMDVSANAVLVGSMSVLGNDEVKIYGLESGLVKHTLGGHYRGVSCIGAGCEGEDEHIVITGAVDRRVRVFDTRLPRRTHCVQVWQDHTDKITSVSIDTWKAVSTSQDRSVCVWDRRTGSRLWQSQDKRWPMQYARFEGPWLVTASYPSEDDLRRLREEERRRAEDEGEEDWELEPWSGDRNADCVRCYDFSDADEVRVAKGLDSIFTSKYDEPQRAKGNVGLVVPYDTI